MLARICIALMEYNEVLLTRNIYLFLKVILWLLYIFSFIRMSCITYSYKCLTRNTQKLQADNHQSYDLAEASPNRKLLISLQSFGTYDPQLQYLGSHMSGNFSLLTSTIIGNNLSSPILTENIDVFGSDTVVLEGCEGRR